MKNGALCELIAEYRHHLKSLPMPWVDAGAYKGEFIDACLNIKPNARIEAFEPQPHRAFKLRRKYADNSLVRIHEKALGAKAENVPFHILNANTFSSVMSPLPSLQDSVGPKAGVQETITVNQVRLDSMLDSPPGFLKLDIQGAELQALHGCGELLSGIKAILVELADTPRYHDQPPSEDIHNFLTSKGFRIQDRCPHPECHGTTVVDFIYFQRKLP